jgi:hypothetical protein
MSRDFQNIDPPPPSPPGECAERNLHFQQDLAYLKGEFHEKIEWYLLPWLGENKKPKSKIFKILKFCPRLDGMVKKHLTPLSL